MNGIDHASYHLACGILARASEMTLATIRSDGSPHASTVSFASDGIVLYAAIAIDSQKAHDIRLDARVSLTVNSPFHTWDDIQGLSIDARASLIDQPAEQDRASAMLLQKLPAYRKLLGDNPTAPWPGMLFVRIVPESLMLLDYTKRFGHSERFAVTGLA